MKYEIEDLEELRKLINRFKNRCTTEADMYMVSHLYTIFIVENDNSVFKKNTTYDGMKIEDQIILMLKDLINFYRLEGKNILIKNNN